MLASQSEGVLTKGNSEWKRRNWRLLLTAKLFQGPLICPVPGSRWRRCRRNVERIKADSLWISTSSVKRLENARRVCPHSCRWCQAQRKSDSLIGCLGQAHFPSFFWAFVAHPGHASLRSLVDAVMAPLHACVGLAVESLALRRASRCAAAIFGFIHKPRPERTTPSGLGG